MYQIAHAPRAFLAGPGLSRTRLTPTSRALPAAGAKAERAGRGGSAGGRAGANVPLWVAASTGRGPRASPPTPAPPARASKPDGWKAWPGHALLVGGATWHPSPLLGTTPSTWRGTPAHAVTHNRRQAEVSAVLWRADLWRGRSWAPGRRVLSTSPVASSTPARRTATAVDRTGRRAARRVVAARRPSEPQWRPAHAQAARSAFTS